MNSHISRTSTFSAPVVQSRLEHHHQQQMLKQPEAKQHHQFHQRSKSLNNKGKRGVSYNHQQKTKETATSSSSSSTSENTIISRNSSKNFSNYSINFDSSYHREQNVGYSNNSNFLVDNGSNGQLQRKTSASSRPSRRHKHSDSVDEDKLRVIPTVSILKRPQSADFVKSNSKSTSSLNVTQEEQGNNNHRPNKAWERSPPTQQRSQSKERRRSDVTPSRSKRPQRKEIRSMEFETDLILNTSNIQLSGSGDESYVNSNKYVKSVSSHNNNTTTATQSNNAFIFPPLNYSNAIIALEEEMNSNKKEDTYSHSDDNATVKSSLNKKRSEHYIESTPRRLSSTAIELQSQVSRFAESDSESLLSSSPSYRKPPSSSPGRLGGAPKLYAGPTFHNSPAPSDLPMPSFYGKSLGKEPSPLSTVGGNNLFTVPENVFSPPANYDNYSSPSSGPSSGNTSDDDIFAMDDFEPSKVPYYPETLTLRKQRSKELLRILNARQHQTAAAYMVPERMATAHHPMQVYPSNDLNEISETLRNLLKIHGQ